MNWGNGIAVFYTLFVIAMVGAVVKSCNNETHLVQENYYSHDIGYEDFRQARQNARSAGNPLQVVRQQNGTIEVSLPKDMSAEQGEIHLFRPSDKYQDKVLPMTLDSANNMVIEMEVRNSQLGKWVLKANWQMDGKKYYQEEILVL